jgi:tetratricopeptide (TPR) repeat protein
MIHCLTFRFAASLSAGALAAIVLFHSAFAATHEQIVARCMEAARPTVRECMQARGRGSLDACRMSVGRAYVYTCVLREEQRQAAGVRPPTAPKEDDGATTKSAASIKPTFVVPPRTIADITAILDSEKPDAAKIAERKAAADASPPANAPPAHLAQFYYDRGSARALLARNKEALADGLQALTIGKGGLNYLLTARIQQMISLQYKALGDPKQAIAALQAIVRLSEQGHRGPVILAMDAIAGALVSMGDISQANTYAGRMEALVQEARGSPHPIWRKFYRDYGNVWEASADSVRALIFEARGQYAEAEAEYRRAEAFRRASVNDISKWDFPESR